MTRLSEMIAEAGIERVQSRGLVKRAEWGGEEG